ncbi:MAG: hypothetical protein M1831_000470 [Alyxoria varia]|nr:MAG: hypothetical protein M1831_000470 [Alyxoria varia]
MSSPTKFPSVSTYRYSSNDPSKTLPVYNPATGELVTNVQVGDTSTVNDAVAAAHKAYQSWRWRTPADRSALLIKCAEALDKHQEEIAEILTTENGKPLQDARKFDCVLMANSFRFFGSLIDKLPTQFYDRGDLYATVMREPYGVTVGVLPFNWPPIHTGGKVAPALAAGNSIILKPGEQAPLTVMRCVEILQSVLPEGLVQAIPGNGPEVPQALIHHPDVHMVSFTGSSKIGKAVAQSAAKDLKHSVFELGGKNAFVVFEDADLDAAVRDALEGAMFNKGEACTATARLLVHERVHDAFVERFVEGLRKLRVGDGFDDSTHVGPVVSAEQQRIVSSYIDLAKKEGVQIAAQAPLPTDPKLKGGYYIQPTLFTGMKRDMRIAQEEMFGPLVGVIPFKTEDEAVSIVNESPYGLTCVIYTAHNPRGMRVARRVEAGCVGLNNYRRNFAGLPFGGVKDSGNTREHAVETLDEWTCKKVIQAPTGLAELPEWRAVTDVYGEKEGKGMSFPDEAGGI